MILIGYYRHYKGGEYEVVGTASHTETMEMMVVYRSLKDSRLWVRPASMFAEMVEVEGKLIPRFQEIEEPSKVDLGQVAPEWQQEERVRSSYSRDFELAPTIVPPSSNPPEPSYRFTEEDFNPREAPEEEEPTASEILWATKRKIEQGWCQGALAKDPSGVPIRFDSSIAVSWSLAGAIHSSTYQPRVLLDVLKQLIAQDHANGQFPTLSQWNDVPCRSKSEVLALLDKALHAVQVQCTL